MKAVEVRDWNPVDAGEIYCSPACGFKCKRYAYDRAKEEAWHLARRLGDGWEMEVWENCGWNYAVKRGVVHIHPRRHGSGISGQWKVEGYTCFIQTSPQFIGKGPNPEAAFSEALGKMQTAFDALTASVGNVKETARALGAVIFERLENDKAD